MERLVHELTRILAVIVTAPLWYPVMKALWQEANKALRREGGILGALPDARSLREIEREERYEEPTLRSVPRDGRQPAAPRASGAPSRASRRAPSSGFR